MEEKAIRWLGSSRQDLRGFPHDARRLAGFQLRQVQRGLEPADWRPMATIGPGVCELRIHTALEHRICYVAKFAEAMYVLHAFEKRTRKTAQHDIEVAKQRYRALVARR
jgi:phage-related protein